MAINKNHEFEELNGVKCGIVEKNATSVRVAFLQPLLEQNGYSVVVVESPAPKTTPAPEITTGEAATPVTTPPVTYTIGVTDYTFNTINAIFGRLLKTPEGGVVTQAYWLQQEASGNDETPYYERG